MENDYNVSDLCAALEVAPSGYYKAEQARREPGPRRERDRQLRTRIETIHAQSRGTYGSPRVHQALKSQNEKVSRKRVARLMRERGLEGAHARARKVKTTDSDHARPVAENLLLK